MGEHFGQEFYDKLPDEDARKLEQFCGELDSSLRELETSGDSELVESIGCRIRTIGSEIVVGSILYNCTFSSFEAAISTMANASLILSRDYSVRDARRCLVQTVKEIHENGCEVPGRYQDMLYEVS